MIIIKSCRKAVCTCAFFLCTASPEANSGINTVMNAGITFMAMLGWLVQKIHIYLFILYTVPKTKGTRPSNLESACFTHEQHRLKMNAQLVILVTHENPGWTNETVCFYKNHRASSAVCVRSEHCFGSSLPPSFYGSP